MPTNTYEIMRRAILARQPVTCRYKGKMREVCPHVLGTTGKREKVLTWQFAGATTTPGGLPLGGEWRCMFVDEITLAVVSVGKWHSGGKHRCDQTCVTKIDVTVAE